MSDGISIRRLGLLAIALVLGSGSTRAQEAGGEVERLRREVEDLREENRAMRRDLDRALREIEAIRADPARSGPGDPRDLEAAVERYLAAREAPPDEGWFDETLTTVLGDEDEGGLLEFHGRATARYVWFDSPRNVDDANPNTFDQSEFVLWIGIEPAERLHVVCEVEFDPTDVDLEIDQARLTFDVLEDERLSLTAGKFYYPFGIERRSYSSVSNKLVDRPAPFRRIFPGTYADIGLMASGRSALAGSTSISYELAFTNGLAGPGRDDRPGLDDNDSKQVGGRAGLSPFEGLEFGVSSLWGRYDGEDELALWLAGADARFTYDGIRFLDATVREVLDLRAEVLYGEVEVRERFPGTGTTWYARSGAYVQLAWRTIYELPALDSLEYVVRADVLDEDDRVDDFRDVWRLAFGVGWAFHPNARLKVEYVRSFELAGGSFENDGVLFELSANW